MVTQATTLYAKWTINSFTVTFDAQGGSAVTEQTVNSGGKPTEPTAPTRTGYAFGGWYKEAACTNAWVFATDVVTQATTLYAKWTAVYSVTYSGNGQTSGDVPTDSVEYLVGSTVTVKSNSGNLAKTGNDFAGWNTAADGTGTSYAPGATFVIGTANVTLYARWQPKPNGVSGTVKDSQNNAVIADCTVNVRTGTDAKTGAILLTTTTSAAGLFSALVDPGAYTLEIQKATYETRYVNVTVVAGEVQTQTLLLSKLLALGTLRMALTWGATPGDFELSMKGPTSAAGRFFIGYTNASSYNYSDAGITAAKDRDSSAGYGPETISIDKYTNAGTYRVYVVLWQSGAPYAQQLPTNSKAKITLYLPGGETREYVMPDNPGTGNLYWTPFEFTQYPGSGNYGTITDLNTCTAVAPN